MYDLDDFDMAEMAKCCGAIRALGTGANTMEDVASAVVRHIYDGMRARNERACAMVRLYKTHPLERLRPAEKRFATQLSKEAELRPETRCLTLMATTGDEPAWNARSSSAGHQAIPLPTEHVIARSPMVAQLIHQLGLDAKAVVRPDAGLLVDSAERAFNVFHVLEASGSRYIPAQDFVTRHGIRSVLGFGGLLPGGDLFATIMFTKVPVSRESAELFKTVALSIKFKLLPFTDKVFS